MEYSILVLINKILRFQVKLRVMYLFIVKLFIYLDCLLPLFEQMAKIFAHGNGRDTIQFGLQCYTLFTIILYTIYKF